MKRGLERSFVLGLILLLLFLFAALFLVGLWRGQINAVFEKFLGFLG